MQADHLANLPPAHMRAGLPHFLAAFLEDPDAAQRCRQRLEDHVADWPDAHFSSIGAHLSSLGAEQRIYDAHPLCQELARVWSREVITGVCLQGAEHLQAARAQGPVLIAGNHLSYYDTTATDAALAWSGHGDLADALVTVAGPKVYAAPFRRVAAAGLNTLPVPQSTSIDGAADLSPRELARLALASVDAARQAMASGRILQIYPEGSRTRTGRLRPFLKGVRRYLKVDGLQVVPAAVLGTGDIHPVGARRFGPGQVSVRYGVPIDVEGAGGPAEALVQAHAAVADLLPQSIRPIPDDPAIR